MSDKYLSVYEAADELGVHWQTMRNYIKSNKIPYTKIGKSYRIDIEDLKKFSSKGKTKEKEKVAEIEHRYVLKNRKEIESNVRDHGGELISHRHVIDHWFVPHHVNSMKENLSFYEDAKGFSLRVREVEDYYSERTMTTLEVKKLADNKTHGFCFEEEILIPKYDEGKGLLNLMSFKEVITIDKDRVIYRKGDIKYVFDKIKNFGEGVEIELKTALELKKAEKQLEKQAKDIGLVPSEREEKSLTYLALRKLADFSER